MRAGLLGVEWGFGWRGRIVAGLLIGWWDADRSSHGIDGQRHSKSEFGTQGGRAAGVTK
jgi:hypothetical protein